MAADFSITGEVKLNSDPAEKATSKWTVAAGQLIADFAKKAASSLQSVVKSGLDYNAQMESYLTNFKVMLGDEQLAAEKLEEIRRMAASTPFSLSDLTEGTQTLLQFGVAADDTTGVLKRLGDISLGNADKLQTLVRAYGKMSSAQKVTLENVNMMIDAGFNPLQSDLRRHRRKHERPLQAHLGRQGQLQRAGSRRGCCHQRGRAVLQRYAGGQPELQRQAVYPEGQRGRADR